MEAMRTRYDVTCECGSRLSYDQTHNYKNYTTIYFDCRGCARRFSIKYNENGDEIERRCIGKAKHGRDRKTVVKPQTICWNCKNAVGGGCSWFTDYTPVEGWEAVKTELRGGYYDYESYLVQHCPEFVDDRRKA